MDEQLRTTWDGGSLSELARTPSEELESYKTPRKPDAGALSRQSSGGARSSGAASGASQSSPTAGEILASAKKIAELEKDLENARKNVHVVDSIVHGDDLTVTWEDRVAGFKDWRACPVNGSHLKDGKALQGMQHEGAKGQVLRATWKSSIKVAIKRSLNSAITNENEIKLFIDLHHPHVVACYGILSGVDSQTNEITSSIVTERCSTSLEAFLDNHDMWQDKKPAMIDMMKYTILQHVALGLQKLHDINVLHRDIKANNILLDGSPGTCSSCLHSGNWKICDFGEACVLQTPKLNFAEPRQWPRGWSDHLVATNRFQPITSNYLRDLGARHYCWLTPGETLRPSDEHVDPPSGMAPDGSWAPCAHGGFVYSFSDDPRHANPADCYFDISGAGDTSQTGQFPASLGPFHLAPTSLLPRLDFRRSSYRLRSAAYQSPELEKLRSFGIEVRGHISPTAPVTLPNSARRAAMIPQDATHFVWAYQGVDLNKLNGSYASQLQSSADLNFVSIGGFVYLKGVTFDPDGVPTDAEVIKANAIVIDGSSSCRAGTIDRSTCGKDTCDPTVAHRCGSGEWCDNAITPAGASPELLEGKAIGLETDIYAFGIVAWEVFTRRQAWHWFHGPQKDITIMNQVLNCNRRPRIPDGMQPDCAAKVRACLHTDPSRRPTAKELTNWIQDCRKTLEDGVVAEAGLKVKESQMMAGMISASFAHRAITERNNQHWTKRGQYSVHSSFSDQGRGSFWLKVVECDLTMWMENGLSEDEIEPAPLSGDLGKIKAQTFGLKFAEPDGQGGKKKTWPLIAVCDTIDKDRRTTIAGEFPEISPGAVITKINGQPIAPRNSSDFKDFAAFKSELQKHPLELEFKTAVAESTDIAKPWIVAGLLEIGLVRYHEARKLQHHRLRSDDFAACNKPHCDGSCHKQQCGNADPEICATLSGMPCKCHLQRTLSPGWRKLAQIELDSTLVAEPEPEPEVEHDTAARLGTSGRARVTTEHFYRRIGEIGSTEPSTQAMQQLSEMMAQRSTELEKQRRALQEQVKRMKQANQRLVCRLATAAGRAAIQSVRRYEAEGSVVHEGIPE